MKEKNRGIRTGDGRAIKPVSYDSILPEAG